MGLIGKIINHFTMKPPQAMQIDIEQLTNFEGHTFINNIWYRGDANELDQLYKQIHENIQGNETFWSSRPSKHSTMRKIHTGLPAMIVDTLADISTDDLDDIEVKKRQKEWDEIAKENKIKDLIRKAVVSTLWSGDGAFKWSIDTDISQYPIIEFYGADRVEYEYERGRLIAIIFKTKKIIKGKKYELRERYDKKGITYKLLDEDKKELDIEKFEELSKYKPVENNAGFMMARQMMFRESQKHEGRGKSILDGKLDSFDAFDEVWSNWMLAVRKGQIKTYIPDCYVPRDPKTGVVLRANDFDSDYVVGSDMSENAKNTIMTTQGQIQYEALLSSYVTALDQCLQGLISPSTLGIDTKKLDNAEAQREKEKTTLYKRNQIVEVLNEVIKDIVNITFKVLDNANDIPPKETEATATFGGYANPSFEAQVETVAKASAGTIMSIEAQVEELWGDTKDDEWKQEEVKRIKFEKGIEKLEEPAINQDINLIEHQLDMEKTKETTKVGDNDDRGE